MIGQPLVETLRTGKDAKQRKQPNSQQRYQLYQGFEGDGHHQTSVFFPWGDVSGAEENGEGSERYTETQGENMGRRFLGEHLQRLGNSPYLQCDIGQGADEHEQRHQHTGQLAAVAEGKQVGQGAELVFPRHPQDGPQQYRTEGKSQGNPQINGQKEIAAGIGEAHAAVVGP